MTAGLYLRAQQTRDREPTAWENAFGDALEAAFASGITTLDALAGALNATRVRPREGGVWTTLLLEATLADLGAA